MAMLYFTLISITALTIGAWGVLNGALYRHPLLLCAFGLLLAIMGGYFSYILDLGSQSKLTEIFEYLKLSSNLMSYTVAAAGGSLIASGIVIKAQHLANQDITKSKDKIKKIAKEIRQIQLGATKVIENQDQQTTHQQQEKIRDLRLELSNVEIRLYIATDSLKKLER